MADLRQMPIRKRRTPPIYQGGGKVNDLNDARNAAMRAQKMNKARGATGKSPIKAPGGRGFSTFLSQMGQNANFKGSGDSRASYEPNKQVRDFQPYGAGKPKYGGGRSMPNVGPVTGREGYRERDLKARVMKARQQKLLKSRGKGYKPDFPSRSA